MKRSLLIVLLFLAVFVINVIILLLVIPELAEIFPFYRVNKFGDMYDRIAVNLIEGNGYRVYPEAAETLMRTPGHPLLLSVIFLFFGKSLVAVKLVHLILALVTAWIITRIARRFSNRNTVILLSPLLFLFHPAILMAESTGKTEILLTCLTALFMLTLYKALESNKRVDYFVAGGILGLASLVKSTPMLFPAFLFFYLLLAKRNSRTTRSVLKNVVAMVIAMLVILSPWIGRNYLVTGRFIPTTSLFGCSVYNGQYVCKNLSTEKGSLTLEREAAMQREELAKEWGRPLFKLHFFQYFYSSVDEVEFDKYLLREALEEYRKTPSLLLKCPLINLFHFWFGGGSWLSTFLNMVVQLPYLILATIGAYLCFRKGQARLIGPIILFMAYYVSVHLPILGRARYSVTLIPFLAILSSIPLAAVWDKYIAKKKSQL